MRCLLCLGEEHIKEGCSICKSFTKRTQVARDLGLNQHHLEQAMRPTLAPRAASDQRLTVDPATEAPPCLPSPGGEEDIHLPRVHRGRGPTNPTWTIPGLKQTLCPLPRVVLTGTMHLPACRRELVHLTAPWYHAELTESLYCHLWFWP